MLCAPNPIAIPTTPALASSGARLMPRSPRMTTLAIEKMVIDAMLRKIEPSARTRGLRGGAVAGPLTARRARRIGHGAPGRRRAQGGGVVVAGVRGRLTAPSSL